MGPGSREHGTLHQPIPDPAEGAVRHARRGHSSMMRRVITSRGEVGHQKRGKRRRGEGRGNFMERAWRVMAGWRTDGGNGAARCDRREGVSEGWE